VSQSPLTADGEADQSLLYKQGWRALNRLLHQDRSFSGRERNCAFINCNGKGFADNSAVTGFNFDDDARALVTNDWDFDGDLDVWLTCRNAPRVRLLENRSGDKTEWLGIKLEGDGVKVNRDAVGCTVEVWVEGVSSPLLRTVHGGDAFLSQTGSFLHFGLGESKKIKKVVVRWGGDFSSEILGIQPSNFYIIKSETQEAVPWVPPTLKPLVASVQNVLPDQDEARIVLPARLPLPQIEGFSGYNEPVLINLWSATCEPCIEELKEWSEGKEKLEKSGLRVHLMNVDEDPVTPLSLPFKSNSITLEGIRALDLFQKAILDRWVDLPVPSSFLIDENNDVAVIYKGRVSLGQLLNDLRILSAPKDSWRVSAVPFPGHFISKLPEPDPTRVSSQFLDANEPSNALSYLEQFNKKYPNSPDVIRMMGILRGGLNAGDNTGLALLERADSLRDSGDTRSAIETYKETLGRFPKTIEAAENLAWILASDKDPSIRKPKEAKALAGRLCMMTRDKDPGYLDLLSVAQAADKDFDGAIKTIIRAIELYENDSEAVHAKKRLELYRQKRPYIK
jgi:tetratricopeptide (TPR) repeat protein